jgi:hypothetical protein
VLQQVFPVQRFLEITNSFQLLFPLIQKWSLIFFQELFFDVKILGPFLEYFLDPRISNLLEFTELLSPLPYFLCQFLPLLFLMLSFPQLLLLHFLLKLFSFILHFLNFFGSLGVSLRLSLLAVHAEFSY